MTFRTTTNFVSFFQPARDHVHLPGAVDMRAGPDLRLVRLARRVPPLERQEEAEALRRALRPHALLLQRHARLAILGQGRRVGSLREEGVLRRNTRMSRSRNHV